MSALPQHLPQRHVLPGTRRRSEQTSRLRVVGPVRHARRYTLLFLLLVGAGVFGIVSLNALAAEAAFEARALENEVADLTVRYEELTVRVAELESPARVRRVAVQQLGMVPADQAAFLVLEEPPVTVASRDADAVRVAAEGVTDPVKQAMSRRR